MDLTLTPDPVDGLVLIGVELGFGEVIVDPITRDDANGIRPVPTFEGPLVGPLSTVLVDPAPALVDQVTYRAVRKRANLMPDASFEGDLSDVTAGSATNVVRTVASTAVVHGEAAAAAVVTGASAGSGYLNKVAPLPAGSEGKWVGVSMVARRSTGATEYAGLYVNFMAGTAALDTGTYLTSWALTSAANSAQERAVAAVQVPAGADGIRVWLRLIGAPAGGAPPSNGTAHTDAWVVAVADTEAEALAAVSVWEGPDYGATEVVEDTVTIEGASPVMLTASVVPGTYTSVPVALIQGYETASSAGRDVYPLIGSDAPLVVGKSPGPRRGQLVLLFDSYERAAAAEQLYRHAATGVQLRQAFEAGLDMVHVAEGEVRLLPAHASGVAWNVEVEFVEVP